MLRGQTLEHRRLRAPGDDGGTLIEPPLAEADDLIRQNLRQRQTDCDLQGRSLSELAAQARRDLLAAAFNYTRQYRDVAQPPAGSDTQVVLAGHQPQLFHPGVWYKNFVLGRLGYGANRAAVNLIIDSDTCKSTALRVPGGTVDRPLVDLVAFDRAGEAIPFEERKILDRDYFSSFGSRASEQIRRLVPDPLLRQFWPLAVERSQAQANLGLCLAQSRHVQEERFGNATLELPQSQVCSLEAFHWFTSHLLAHLPRLWDVYNGAVAEYRRANHLRSKSHPVPDLASHDQWLEAPYWIWTHDNPLRRPLFVRSRGDDLLLADRRGLEIALPLSPESDAQRAVAVLAELAGQGIKLRTRALITTMFARLVLGDLFLHGIGGAKYDEVTDLVIRRFLGVEPPAYLTVTATLRLPIRHAAVSPDALRSVEGRLREMEFHPEQFLEPADLADREVATAVTEKRTWVETPQTRENARQRCTAIRHANTALQPRLQAQRERLADERAQISARLEGETILGWREYAFVLYPEETLRGLLVGSRPCTANPV